MWLRHAFFRWLIPAAFVLPLWLVVGWIIFGASPWALLWVLVSAPIIFVAQLVLTLLIRARGTVRAARAVSWSDLGVLGAWHVFIVLLGLFANPWWWGVFALTVAAGIASLWVVLAQLWREARPSAVLRTADGVAYVAPPQSTRESSTVDPDVVIITERTPPTP